jgi:hypothetical protein
MDAQNNPTAQHFEALMQQEDEKRKKAVSEIITKQANAQETEEPEPPADYGFLDKVEQKNGKDTTNFVSRTIVTPGNASSDDGSKEAADPDLSAAEKAYLEKDRKLSKEVHAKSAGFKPKSALEKASQAANRQPKNEVAAMTKSAQNANLKELSQSGNDLSVASVQKLANRNEVIKQISPNEVEIDLHSR